MSIGGWPCIGSSLALSPQPSSPAPPRRLTPTTCRLEPDRGLAMRRRACRHASLPTAGAAKHHHYPSRHGATQRLSPAKLPAEQPLRAAVADVGSSRTLIRRLHLEVSL